MKLHLRISASQNVLSRCLYLAANLKQQQAEDITERQKLTLELSARDAELEQLRMQLMSSSRPDLNTTVTSLALPGRDLNDAASIAGGSGDEATESVGLQRLEGTRYTRYILATPSPS